MSASALYTGEVRHRRLGPKPHAFRYRLFFCWLDLAELATVFRGRWLWSTRRPALAWFRRADYLGPTELPLDEAVRQRVTQATGRRPDGPIRLLTHIRQFGWCFNPVSFYYCYDRADTRVEAVVAEITNTPWDERHAYVLAREAGTPEGPNRRWRFGKDFHVSPFLPMDMDYDWRLSEPGERLAVHMENWRAGRLEFDATLALTREPISGASLARALVSFPLLTAKVSAMIYWNALRLWLKRTPFFTHPPTADAPASRRPT
jgi:DUF1365 family protein